MSGISIINQLQSIKPDKEAIARLGGLAAIQALVSPTGEPLKGFMWEVHVLNHNTATDTLPNLTFYARSAVIPETQIDVIEVNYLGDKYAYAGKNISAKTASLTFWDDQEFTVYSFFQNWMNTLATPILGRQVSKANYARDIVFELRDTTDLFTVARITLLDAFIMNLNDSNLDYDSSSVLSVSVNLSYDRKIVGEKVDEKYTPRESNKVSDITDSPLPSGLA
jgi:hypothetical protein